MIRRIRRRRVLNRHRALLQALTVMAVTANLPRRRKRWPENVGVARETMHAKFCGELLRGDQ